MMLKLTVLITSPSLEISKNVSGIAALTKLTIEKNTEVEYVHFTIGKQDNQKRNLKWLLMQPSIILKFLIILIKTKVDVVHINMPLSRIAIFINFTLVVISKILGKKTILHLRGGELSLKKTLNPIFKSIIKRSIKLANKVIVLGHKEHEYISSFFSIDWNKVHVLPNAVIVPNDVDINSKFEYNKKVLNIIYIGRIDSNKGFIELIKALSELPSDVSYNFSFGGVGPYLEELHKLCLSSIPTKYTYLGILNEIQKKEVYSQSDIFILPSYFEGLPNSLLESMAYGIVPIVTPVGSIPEVVFDKLNGFLVPLHDYKSITQNILNLNYDRNLLHSMSMAANKSIRSSYGIIQYIKNLNEIYCHSI